MILDESSSKPTKSRLLFLDGIRDPGKPGLILRGLESTIAVWLGLISYSLYLIHPPIVAMTDIVFDRLRLQPSMRLPFMMVVGVAGSVLVGWLFHITVERWFIPKSDPRKKQMMAEVHLPSAV